MFRPALFAVCVMLTGPALATETVRFAVTDVDGLEAMQQEFGAFEAALEEATGYDIQLYPVSSRTAAVEAINQNQVDMVLTGPAEYVVMKELAQPEIIAAWQRPNYFAQLVALARGPIRSVEDLRGKRVTFGAIGSTSQHLGPAQVLQDLGLVLGTDYTGEIVPRNVAVEALIRGDVAAVGMTESHLRLMRETYPDQAFAVIARGRDLPNDVLVARKGMDPAMLATLRAAFTDKGEMLLAAVLQGQDNRKYEGGFFLTGVTDSDYDYVRSMYRTIGVDTSDFVGE